MKRFARKTIVVMIGLILGWTAAGFVGGFPDHVYAADKPATEGAKAEDGKSKDQHHDAAGENVAHSLVPKKDQIGFYKPVLMIIGGLFLAALVVGIAGKAMGVRDPGIVATEEDNAEAHDHDDHH